MLNLAILNTLLHNKVTFHLIDISQNSDTVHMLPEVLIYWEFKDEKLVIIFPYS